MDSGYSEKFNQITQLLESGAQIVHIEQKELYGKAVLLADAETSSKELAEELRQKI